MVGGFLLLVLLAIAIYGYATNAQWASTALALFILATSFAGKRERPRKARPTGQPTITPASARPPGQPTIIRASARPTANAYEQAKQAEQRAESNRAYQSGHYASEQGPKTFEARAFDFRPNTPAPEDFEFDNEDEDNPYLEELSPEQLHALVMKQLGVETPRQALLVKSPARAAATVAPAPSRTVRMLDHGTALPHATPEHDAQALKTHTHLAQIAAGLPRSSTPLTLAQMRPLMPERTADPRTLPSRIIANTLPGSFRLLMRRSAQRRMIQRELARQWSAGSKDLAPFRAPSAKQNKAGTLHAPLPVLPTTRNPLVRG